MEKLSLVTLYLLHNDSDSTCAACASPSLTKLLTDNALFQTQANLLDAVVEMNNRQLVVERRTDRIEDSLRHLQVTIRTKLACYQLHALVSVRS